MGKYTQEEKEAVRGYAARYGVSVRAAQIACRRGSEQWRRFLKEGGAGGVGEGGGCGGGDGGEYRPADAAAVARRNWRVCVGQYEMALGLADDMLAASVKNKFVVKSLKECQLAVTRAQENVTRARLELEAAARSSGELVAWAELEELAGGLAALGGVLRDLPEAVGGCVEPERRAEVYGAVEEALIDKVNPVLTKILEGLSHGR